MVILVFLLLSHLPLHFTQTKGTSWIGALPERLPVTAGYLAKSEAGHCLFIFLFVSEGEPSDLGCNAPLAEI